MNLSILCECGESVSVTEGDAGSRVTCRCGRTVVVPSFRELRRQAGVPVSKPTPEMALEALLLAGKLPEEEECVLCSEVTSGCATCLVDCERAYVSDGRPHWLVWVAFYLAFGWIGALLVWATRSEGTEWGKDRAFRLPLRICDRCRPRLHESGALRRALRDVPLYRQLLAKYPRATISLIAKTD
jgi:hypothetical protein